MRIVTLNVNGIRSAARKGLFNWLSRQRADVVCLQEVRAQADQISAPQFHPRQFHCFYEPAQRKGYSGVALYSRNEPDAVIRGFGSEEFDAEGRYIEARFGPLSIVSLYLPSGSSSEERQQAKFRFMKEFEDRLRTMRAEGEAAGGRQYLLCGDWNIAHKEIDLKNWRGNRKNSGFLPEERTWLDELFGPLGFTDTFREVNPEPEQYTWWSNRGQAWANNVGWRIDYQIGTPGLKGAAGRASIYKDNRFSDHAPLLMDFDLNPGTGR
ncbi:MAG: exodeoxyribonuclease III [Gammaproteobacteria bacterium]